MKILMVHPHDVYSDLEPWTVRIDSFARELSAAGHQVRLVHHELSAPRDVAGCGRRESHPFEIIGFPRTGLSLSRRCGLLAKFVQWADVVHFQKCSHYSALPAVLCAYYYQRPVHYDWDDWEQRIYELDEHSRIGSWIFFQQMERHLLKLADTVSVASDGLRSLALGYDFPVDRLFTAPVGVDTDAFSPSVSGEPVRRSLGLTGRIVLYHGQISGANYVHLFIEAAKSVCDKCPDVTFIVVGGGDRLEKSRKYASDLGLGDRVRFIGEVPHADVPMYISSADVVVACFEDNEQARCKSPLKVVEYMASGKAIVASRVGEVPGMIGDGGLLVEPGSPETIGVAINTLLDDRDTRAKLGRKARERAETHFTWKRSALTLMEAYEKALRVRHDTGRR